MEFWFDFISPYGFLASLRIDELAARHQRQVSWRPMLLGVSVLKVMGLKPLMATPLKAEYAVRELARYQRRHGVHYRRALTSVSMNPLPAARAFAWLLKYEKQHAKPFAREVLDRYWMNAIDMDSAQSIETAAREVGIPPDVVKGMLFDGESAGLLRAHVDEGISGGVFGSPFIVVDGEPFFGVDKLELVEQWLQTGGW